MVPLVLLVHWTWGYSSVPFVGSPDSRSLEFNSTVDGELRFNGVRIVRIWHIRISNAIHFFSPFPIKRGIGARHPGMGLAG